MTEPLDALRTLAAALAADAKDAAAAEKAAQVLKAISETERTSAEADKIRAEKKKLEDELSDTKRSNGSTDWKQVAAVLVPVFSTLILGGTLILQSYQAYNSENDKRIEQQQQRAAAEDARWQEALKSLSGSKEISTTALYIKMFLNNERYNSIARQTAFQLLASTDDTLIFKDLFDSVYVPVTWDNLSQITDLSRNIVSRTTAIIGKKRENQTPEEQKIYDAEFADIKLLCTRAAPLLKSKRPAGAEVDLRAVSWWDCDLSNSDLSGANLAGFVPTRINFKGADLTGVTFSQNDSWETNTWWKAARISPNFLTFLKEKWPYDPNMNYGDSSTTAREYQDDIVRLSK